MKQFLRQSLRCSLAASTLAVAGVAATASGAFAQAAPVDSTVNFTGTVGSVCTFSNVVDGALTFDGFSLLEADAGTGTRGSVDLDCTGPAEVSVSIPTDNGSTTELISSANGYGAQVDVAPGSFASNTLADGASAPIILGGPVNETLDVGMYIISDGAIPAGAYDYNVVVTATPQ